MSLFLGGVAIAAAYYYYYGRVREEDYEKEPEETYTRAEDRIEEVPKRAPVEVSQPEGMHNIKSLVASTFATKPGTYYPVIDSDHDFKHLNIANRYLYG